MDKDWYAAVIITRSTCAEPDHRSLYQESVVLIEAPSEEAAIQAAKSWADNNTPRFANSLGEQIQWVLEAILEVKKLDEPPGHLVDVYTRFFRNYEAYRQFEPLLEGDID